MFLLEAWTAIIAICGLVVAKDETCIRDSKKLHRFYPLRHCQRSNKTVIALENFNRSSQCANYARERRGLAFNFSPKSRGKTNIFTTQGTSNNKTSFPISARRRHILDQPEEFFNCHVLECPEYQNFSNLVNDSRFDYYSLYTDPPPPLNATCIPYVGMFHFYESPQNYSVAATVCVKKSNGSLAHILSESRTNRISRFLAKMQPDTYPNRLKLGYVGLNYSQEEGNFITAESENMGCYFYSAWAPGHPREKKNASCVAITTRKSWFTVDCRTKLPFICEIYSSGPNKNVDIGKKCLVNRPNNQEIYKNDSKLN